MSKYWDPAWEKPTYGLTFVKPSVELLEWMTDATRPAHWEEAPPSPELCWHGDRSRVANFGPDTVLLVPAPNRVLTADLQEEIGSLNYYFICSRPRILARNDCQIVGDQLHLGFDIFLDDGTVEVFARTLPVPENVRSLEVIDHGVTLRYHLTEGEALHDAALSAQTLSRTKRYQPSRFDLEVHYIGRARGVLAEKCALDRLENHGKYQAVMEDILRSPHRNRDVWLLLGAGTTMDIFGSAKGEAPDPSEEEMARETQHTRSTLSKARRVDVTESLLINYFKPALNDQQTGDLDLTSKTYKHCYDAGLTGLLLIFPTGDLGVALYTDHIERALWNVMSVCLYP